MDDIKAAAAKHHEDTAHRFEVAAKMHYDVAKHSASGSYEKAESLATSAAEADGVDNRHAIQAVDSYRHHARKVPTARLKLRQENRQGPLSTRPNWNRR